MTDSCHSPGLNLGPALESLYDTDLNQNEGARREVDSLVGRVQQQLESSGELEPGLQQQIFDLREALRRRVVRWTDDSLGAGDCTLLALNALSTAIESSQEPMLTDWMEVPAKGEVLDVDEEGDPPAPAEPDGTEIESREAESEELPNEPVVEVHDITLPQPAAPNLASRPSVLAENEPTLQKSLYVIVGLVILVVVVGLFIVLKAARKNL